MVLFAVVLVGYIVISHDKKTSGAVRSIRVTSSKLVTKDGSHDPKAVVSFYEDFLCPACGNFERGFGPTVSKLIDSGAIAADYYMVGTAQQTAERRVLVASRQCRPIASPTSRSTRSGDSTPRCTPRKSSRRETGTTFPDNAKLIEIAREAGVVGKVPDCVKAGKYPPMVDGLAAAAGIHATPTVRINGQEYQWSTPDAFVAKIKEIVGDVPGIDSAATPAAS